METIPNEIRIMIFSYLEVEDLLRCATVNKSFQVTANDKALWKKLPIYLGWKQVPVGFLRHILKLGTAYLTLSSVEILGDPNQLSQTNSLKYLHLSGLGENVMKNLLKVCTKLEKLSFYIPTGSTIDDTCQCIRQNSRGLTCLQVRGPRALNEMETDKFANDISKCEQLEEISLRLCRFDRWTSIQNLFKNLPENLKQLHLETWLNIEDLKVLVATNSELEQIDCQIDVSFSQYDEILSIIVGSHLCEKLVNLNLGMFNGIFVHEQFDAKCLELRQMKNLKKITFGGMEGSFVPGAQSVFDMNVLKKANHLLKRNHPHLMEQQDKFSIPASTGFPGRLWEMRCRPLNLFTDR